ncbi:SHOCT domain-containing protein [Halosimplex halophilum]|uniref:SHOCT domain-containing protein n=1 Tax=Halosimplex halophilum TaxID=2559572 RepID=UPI001FE30B91|nr:SHOCT domain-containing protein [Halosimplex halophilum]
MGDDEDGIDWQRVGRVATEPDGSLHWGRVRSAVRGRGSRDDADLTALVVLALLWTLVGPVLPAVFPTVVGLAPWQMGGLGAVVLLGLVATVADRLDAYEVTDDDVVIEELRARYAAGALSLDEFERRVERVVEDGPGAVDPSIGDGNPDDGERDPVAILRERYARGEIDDEEYRSRLDVLGEDVPDRVSETS